MDQNLGNQGMPPATIILASWIYGVSEWKQFLQWEKRQKMSNILVEVISIFAVSMLLIRLTATTGWMTAIVFGAMTGLVYVPVRYFLAMVSIEKTHHKTPEVIITPEALLINGHMRKFHGKDLWLCKVNIKETKEMNLLEITYCRKSKTEKVDEMRVPVPKGKLREAIRVQEELNKKIDKL